MVDSPFPVAVHNFTAMPTPDFTHADKAALASVLRADRPVPLVAARSAATGYPAKLDPPARPLPFPARMPSVQPRLLYLKLRGGRRQR